MALARLRQQARLQVQQRTTDTLPFEVLPRLGEHLGFQALPAPTPNDLFFDMEGDPFVGDNGIEYLFGILELNAREPSPETSLPLKGMVGEGVMEHHTFWGHDPDEEKRAFEQVVDFLIERLNRNPDLHVYHYAPYEPNALKWLASTYATREAEVDRLLRGRVLVDLYRAVRQSVRIGTESYSLKELESLYRPKRSTEIVDAAGSIVAYEDWLESRDQRLGEADLIRPDRAFALELFYGVLRNITLLDFWIDRLRTSRIDIAMRDILRLGLYQLFLLGTARHAAVFETVALAPKKQRAVINGVLRAATRRREELCNQADAQPLFVRTSHPQFLIERWESAFGTVQLE